jgi:hypothetical protein
MLAVIPLLKRFPSNAHQNYLITEMSKSFTKWDSAFYLDLYVFEFLLTQLVTEVLTARAKA